MRIVYLLLYEIKYAFSQMRKNFALCVSAISAIFISVFLISIFLIVGFHIDSFSQDIESDVRIHVVLNADILDETQIQSIQDQIQSISNVDTVTFSSKDEELELMIAEKGSSFEIYRGESNPLANAFFVTVKDGDQIDQTSDDIQQIEGVSACAYGGGSVVKLMTLLNKVRYVGYGAIGLLMLLCLYLLYNTISSTINSQEDEIAIMTTVGASRSFVRVPFAIQGMVIGLVGSVMTYYLLRFGYTQIYEVLNGVLLVNVLKLIEPSVLIHEVGWIVILMGIVLGYLASMVAVSKHIRQNR